jgi:hypothetical protein
MTEHVQLIKVYFTHPRDSRAFPAEVEPTCTGKQAIEGLLVGDSSGPFLDPPPPGRPYSLVTKKGKQIAPNMTFQEAGVSSGDVITIHQDGQGA